MVSLECATMSKLGHSTTFCIRYHIWKLSLLISVGNTITDNTYMYLEEIFPPKTK